MSEIFTFVDASHLISKASLWQERDEVIQKNTKSLITKLYRRLHTINRPELAAKAVINFGMDIKNM